MRANIERKHIITQIQEIDNDGALMLVTTENRAKYLNLIDALGIHLWDTHIHRKVQHKEYICDIKQFHRFLINALVQLH